MKKYFPFFILASSLVVVIIIAIAFKPQKMIELTTFPQAYNIVSLVDEQDQLAIDLYINHKDSYLINHDNISHAYLLDKQNNQLKLKIVRIDATGEYLNTNHKKYYGYQFHFEIPINATSELTFTMEEANLILEYIQGTNIDIRIGSFCYYKVLKFGGDEITINKLKGVVNEIDGKKTLVGLGIGIKNHLSEHTIIKKIIPLDVNVFVSYQDYQEIKNFEPTSNISELLGYHYDVNFQEKSDCLNLEIDDEGFYLFPLKYTNTITINKLGFIVEYEVDKEIKRLYYDDFTFFNTNQSFESIINQLVFYHYENY